MISCCNVGENVVESEPRHSAASFESIKWKFRPAEEVLCDKVLVLLSRRKSKKKLSAKHLKCINLVRLFLFTIIFSVFIVSLGYYIAY